MNFVHPLFLWALLTLAIPVIIHLFNFRRTQKVFFSNIRLLEMVREASSKKRRLRHLLVLFSRLFFLLFLVMAFAQPFLPAEENMGSDKKVVLYLDNSPSMSVPMPDKSRALDQAIAYAKSVVDLFPKDTRFLVLTNEFSGSLNFKSAAEATEALAAIRISYISRSFEEVARKVQQANGSDLFYLSDFQRSTLGGLSEPDSTKRYSLIPIQPEELRNVYVDSAAFDNPYTITGEKATLSIWIRNDSREKVEQVNFRITAGNTLVSASTISLEPLAVEPFQVDITMSNHPFPMKISLQDFPVAHDNDFYLAVLPLPKLNILHLYAGKQLPYIKEVFGNTNLFLVRSQSISSMNFNWLDQADLIVLEGIDQANLALEQHLRDHPEQKALIIPSENPNPVYISKLTGVRITKGETIAKIPVAVPPFQNPFFENVFEEKNQEMNMPEATPLLEWPADRSAILQFKDGKPMLSQFGRFYLLASSLTPIQSNLATHALFVPLMYRMAAASRGMQWKPYQYLNQGLIDWPADSSVSEVPVRLKGSMEVIPQQRIADGRLIMELPATRLDAGTYFAIRQRDTLGIIALNADRKESKMDLWSKEDLVKKASSMVNATVFEGGSLQAFSKGIKERYLGVPLWKYCLILALLFLFTEVILLRFFWPDTISKDSKPT